MFNCIISFYVLVIFAAANALNQNTKFPLLRSRLRKLEHFKPPSNFQLHVVGTLIKETEGLSDAFVGGTVGVMSGK